MFKLPRQALAPLQRLYHSSVSSTTTGSLSKGKLISLGAETSSDKVWQINSRLENLSLQGQYFSGKPLLELPSTKNKKIHCPTTSSNETKKFIVDKPVGVKNPAKVNKVISDPLSHTIVKKHAIRMLVLRRKKMKKHQLKRLWDRMYLRFRAKRINLEKNKELEFRGRLASKVADARKFDPEKYVDEYLNDYHTPLIPKTYDGKFNIVMAMLMVKALFLLFQGKRLPEWLIKELLEQDRLHAKEEQLRGKEVTKAEEIIKPGETVKDFIARTWNK